LKTSFYQQQENARRRTKQLVVAFHVVVFLTAILSAMMYVIYFRMHRDLTMEIPISEAIFQRDVFGVVLVVYFMIFAIAWVRSLPLSAGGSYVAKMVGGREISFSTTDLAEKQLVNIVEEMGIAAGMTLPRIYVLDHEDAINAFAAGTSVNNACVAVSKGAMRKLNRSELQGVIAHEFSHILNGDMKLNIHLLGYLYGLTSVVDIGRMIMRNSGRSRKNNAAPLGLGLIVVGSLGYFFASMLRAGVSRDRERLADASAVQFTRNPEGIGGALRKIWRDTEAVVVGARSPEISHFFLHWPQSFFGLFDTHPPLSERIRSLGLEQKSADLKTRKVQELEPLQMVSQLAPQSLAPVVEFNPLHVGFVLYLWLEPSPGLGPVDAILRWNPTIDEAELTDVYHALQKMDDEERFAILEKSVARLRTMDHKVVDEFMGQLKALIEEDRHVSAREFLYYHYLQVALRVGKAPKVKVTDENTWESVKTVATFFGKILVPEKSFQFADGVFQQLGKVAPMSRPERLSEVKNALNVLAQVRPLLRPKIYLAFVDTAHMCGPKSEGRLALRLLALVLEVT
jgi:Zn-dependent protease with chaperone function